MKLAIVDSHGNVVHTWDSPSEARSEIAERVARDLGPRERLHRKRRESIAETVDRIIRSFQAETARL